MKAATPSKITVFQMTVLSLLTLALTGAFAEQFSPSGRICQGSIAAWIDQGMDRLAQGALSGRLSLWGAAWIPGRFSGGQGGESTSPTRSVKRSTPRWVSSAALPSAEFDLIEVWPLEVWPLEVWPREASRDCLKIPGAQTVLEFHQVVVVTAERPLLAPDVEASLKPLPSARSETRPDCGAPNAI